MADDLKVPDFDDLSEVQGMPKGCAWGVFDKEGKKDVYGTLNLLTPNVVREAVQEVKEGVSVSLKYAIQTSPKTITNCFRSWPIGAVKTPEWSRKVLVHKVISYMDTPYRAHGFDDEVLCFTLVHEA